MRAIYDRGLGLLRISGPVQQIPCQWGTARVVPEGATFTCAARCPMSLLETLP